MNPMYMFEYYPLHVIPNMAPEVVYTTDRDLMTLFLQQHGFDPNTANVKIIDDEIDEDDPYMLHIWRMGSRKRDRIYNVATTSNIIENVVLSVGLELSEAMTLGAISFRGDIQVFERIGNLISMLDYVYQMDGFAADAGGYDVCDKETYSNGYPYYEEIAINHDDSFLYDALISDSHPSKDVQPITIESYVSFFTDRFIIGQTCSNQYRR